MRAAALALLLLAAAGAPAPALDPPQTPVASCLADDQVEEILVHDGVQYLAGRFTHVRPPGAPPGDPTEVERKWFAACDAATGAVLAWNPQADCVSGGSSCNQPRGMGLALSADGAALYLGGRFDRIAGATQLRAAKVSRSTAARDPAFAPAPNNIVQRLLLAPDGQRLYVAGSFNAIGGCSPAPCHAYLAAVDPASGALVAAFDPEISTAIGSFLSVYAMAIDAAGDTIYFGGWFDLVNGAVRTSLAAVDTATGQTNRAFAPRLEDANVSDPYPQVYDVRLDGRFVYVCGDWWSTESVGSQQDQRNVNRFDPLTGAVDDDFWIATDGGVQGCDLDRGLDLLFVGGHFDCVRAYTNAATPVDPTPPPCGTDPLFVGTVQRDLFALDLRDGDLVAWNPDTSGVGGAWAVVASPGRLDVGGQLGWPRTGTATHENLLVFVLPLFADGFESAETDRWSSTTP